MAGINAICSKEEPPHLLAGALLWGIICSRTGGQEIEDHRVRFEIIPFTIDTADVPANAYLGHLKTFAIFSIIPKVIWIRSGNSPTDLVESLLRDNYDLILAFEQDPGRDIIELRRFSVRPYCAVAPPSITSSAPVTKDDSSDAR